MTLSRIGKTAVWMTLTSMTAGLAAAQCLPVDTLDPGGLPAAAVYGASVVMDAERAVVGAPFDSDDSGSTFRGAVYTWQHDGTTWQLERKITAPDGEKDDEFGHSLSISGNLMAIGAPGDDDLATSAGAVYVYRFDGTDWQFEVKLTRGASGERLGHDVSIDGDVLMASNRSVANGRVEVFRYQGKIVGWQLEDTLTGTDSFGISIDLEGDRVIVGEPFGTSQVAGEGLVRVFEFDGAQWNPTQVLTSSQAAQGNRFGDAVAMDDKYIVIGAPTDSSGAVHLFELKRGVWNEHERFVTGDRKMGDQVAIQGKVAVAGGELSNRANEFRRVDGLWFQAGIFEDPTTERLGQAVAVYGHRAIFGSRTRNGDANGAHECPVARLRLTASDTAPSAGDSVSFTTLCGPPGNPVGYFLVHVNNVPTFKPLIFFVFDPGHQLTLTFPVPTGLTGITTGLQTYGVGPGGKKDVSNVVDIAFQ